MNECTKLYNPDCDECHNCKTHQCMLINNKMLLNDIEESFDEAGNMVDDLLNDGKTIEDIFFIQLNWLMQRYGVSNFDITTLLSCFVNAGAVGAAYIITRKDVGKIDKEKVYDFEMMLLEGVFHEAKKKQFNVVDNKGDNQC